MVQLNLEVALPVGVVAVEGVVVARPDRAEPHQSRPVDEELHPARLLAFPQSQLMQTGIFAQQIFSCAEGFVNEVAEFVQRLGFRLCGNHAVVRQGGKLRRFAEGDDGESPGGDATSVGDSANGP